MNNSPLKSTLSEFLSFLKYKVDNDLLTMEEVESLAHTIEEGLTVRGTTDDLANFYGQPKTNISSLISRKMVKKPVRRVYYSFKAFRKIVPEKWKKV